MVRNKKAILWRSCVREMEVVVVYRFGWMDAWGITGRSSREVTGSVLALPLPVSFYIYILCTYRIILIIHYISTTRNTILYVSRHVSIHSLEAIPSAGHVHVVNITTVAVLGESIKAKYVQS